MINSSYVYCFLNLLIMVVVYFKCIMNINKKVKGVFILFFKFYF